MNRSINILHVDPDPILRELFVEGIINEGRRSEFDVTGCGLSPYDIRKILNTKEIDILLMEIEDSPPIPTPETTDETVGLLILREMHVSLIRMGVKVILLIIHPNIMQTPSSAQLIIGEALDSGLAQGYMQKPFCFKGDELNVLRQVAQGVCDNRRTVITRDRMNFVY